VRISNGDLELHVDVDGPADAPPVLLLHGITSSTLSWEWLVPSLKADYRVIRLDFRGHGKSDRAPGAYSMQGYVTDAIAACEQVAGRATAVVGHSLGGATAAALAQQRPEIVTAVVLEDPPLYAADASALRDNSLMAGFALMRESVPRMQEQGVPADVLANIIRSAPSATGPVFGELVHGDALTAMAASLLALDATVLDPVLSGRVERAFDADVPITVPVLVVAGDPAFPDTVARTADLERFAARTPDAVVHVVRGAGHLVHDELAHRDEFASVVREFLTRHVGGGAS
jgi:pimeloyl-ACP methyl ester carboxylesterase